MSEPTANKPKPGDWRMTVTVLQSGQTRAYGDTLRHYRVLFEWVPYRASATETPNYEPTEWVQAVVEPKLRGIYGWRLKPDGTPDNAWPGPRLDFIKKVGPGLWEFRVVEDYTD